jgi:hypothetical protein
MTVEKNVNLCNLQDLNQFSTKCIHMSLILYNVISMQRMNVIFFLALNVSFKIINPINKLQNNIALESVSTIHTVLFVPS